jgi:chloramphenicol-sensitive protein RarD
MQFKKMNETLIGIASGSGAYLLWGVLPAYWKLVYPVPAQEILAHRIIWSFFLMLGILIVTKRLRLFLAEFRYIISQPKKLFCVIMAALLISVNWVTYIWAVNDNRIIETSLGYYINPLVSGLLGIIVLKEKLSFWQTIAFLLASIGVLHMTLNFGAIPWISLLLAFSFGLYGLFKKMVKIGAITGITLETLIVAPIAFLYLAYLQQQGSGAFTVNLSTAGLLMGAGIVTAIPLILFTSAANRLPLTVLGFLQYISPTISLAFGVFLYNEPFTAVHFVSFAFIWVALTILSLARTKTFIQFEAMLSKKCS